MIGGLEELMHRFRRAALGVALALTATACGSTTGPEADVVRMLPAIYESTIVVPDTVQLGTAFGVEFDVNAPPDFGVEIDLEYYAADVVVLPSAAGDYNNLAGTGLGNPTAAHVDVVFEAAGHRTVKLVGSNGTFERTVLVVE